MTQNTVVRKQIFDSPPIQFGLGKLVEVIHDHMEPAKTFPPRLSAIPERWPVRFQATRTYWFRLLYIAPPDQERDHRDTNQGRHTDARSQSSCGFFGRTVNAKTFGLQLIHDLSMKERNRRLTVVSDVFELDVLRSVGRVTGQALSQTWGARGLRSEVHADAAMERASTADPHAC
jgi:hypothetical protein